MSHFSKTTFAALPLCVGGFFVSTLPAAAACTISSDFLTVDCSGPLAAPGTSAVPIPITLYDAAAGFQPTNGSNSYTPASIDPNPPTVTLNFDDTVNYSLTTNTTAGVLADRGMVVANYSNDENPAVNNVVVNNAGILSLTTSQIAQSGGGRMDVIVADSQVNNFTVNNTNTVEVTQNFFSSFNKSNLSVTSSGSPATYTGKYSGATLADMADFYADDNTNEYTVNNAYGASALATGNFATVYYGRADTTINNSGTFENTSWVSSDTIANGHWAIAAWAGTDYDTVPNTNPDSNIVFINPDGSVTVEDTSALTLTNNSTGVIKGDVLALDITPLVYAAAVGTSSDPFPDPSSTSVLPYAVSSSNAGPRDSNIENYGQIDGNFYLGSGTHVIDNAAGATINGNVDVDQRPFEATFSTPTAGSVAGTYLSAGGTDFAGNACPASGQNTTDAGCAQTHTVEATVVGGQSLTLTNEGTWNGNINIFDTPTSVNTITLTGSGFTGTIDAVNGTGSNSLTLNGVTQLTSVQNFSYLNLEQSNVEITGGAGVSLVSGATIATTIYGPGGTLAAPSLNLGSLTFATGSLDLKGPTTVDPTFTGAVSNGAVYQLASAVTGDTTDVTVDNTSALVTLTATDPAPNTLILTAAVVDPSTIPGLSNAGASTLSNLINYTGTNPSTQALAGAVESLTTLDDVRGAAEQLRPEVNGASIQVPLEIATQFDSAINMRLQTYFYGALPQPTAEPQDLPNTKGAPLVPVAQDNGLWFNAIGSALHQQQNADVSGYVADIGGFVVGYDHTITDNFRLGGAIGYGISSINDTVLSDHSSFDTVNGLVYGSLTGANWYVNAIGSYGSLHYDATRDINFTGFSDTAFAGRNGSIYSGRAETGYAFVTPMAVFVPVASLTYAHIDQAAYSETSFNGAGLSVGDQQTDSLRTGLGGQVIVPVVTSPTFATAFEAHAVWLHEFEDTAENVTASFVGSGSTFTATGPDPSREMADVGADVRMSLPLAGDSLSVGYTAILRDQYVEQIGLVRARFDF